MMLLLCHSLVRSELYSTIFYDAQREQYVQMCDARNDELRTKV